MPTSTPLAIVGLSAIFPQADDLRAYWRNLKAGTDAITALPATHWRGADFFNADPKAPDMTYAQRGGFISPVNFNPLEFGIAPKDIEATDTTQLLGMVAAKQALADAGYDQKPFDRQRTSVLLGVTGALELVIPLGARLGHPIWRRALKEAGVANDVAEDVVQRIADGYVPWQENSFPGLLGNVAAGRIASRLDLGGTNCVVDAACASSFAALHLAGLELEAGRSDMVICGGVDTFNDIFMFMCFSKTPALSPSGNSRPFDRDGDGTILGEGIGMVVIKRLADAERDGDRIYCTIKGIGSSSDGRGGAIYEPRSEGQIQAMERAYAAAGISADTVELVEAHGTGTKVGDATELRSLTKVFRAAKPDGTWAALGSVKSQIGHTKAAAGVAGLIKAALALEQKVLPPTIKVNQPLDEAAPGTSPFYLNTTKRPWLPRAAHPRRAGVSAFGFGGTNFHIALEEHGSARRAVDWTGDVDILAFAADTLADLRAQLAALPAELPWLDLRRRAHASRAAFRAEAKFRLLLPLAKGTESNFALASLRDAALAMLDKEPAKTSWSLPNGTAFGSGPARGQLAVLFPGQGSQYPGMFRDLACQFPELLDTLAEADAAFAVEQPAVAQRLSDVIYPHPAFNDETRLAQESALKATEVAQPALGAVSLGALRVLQNFGIAPQLAAGHSYGELVALHAAGRLDAAGLHKLSNVRGRLMASRPGAADRGAMLAVVAPEQTVAELLLAGGPDLVIANRNSPSQFVIAGPKPQIDRAAVEAEKRSLRARVLPVSAAFHSPLVADAREPFAAALAEVEFSPAQVPVFSNTTASPYPPAASATRDVLASHLTKPVDFIGEIRALHAAGATTFLEVGPGRVLSDLAAAILADTGAETIALDASRGARNGTLDLAAALCRLAALGHTVDLAKWETAPPAAPTGKPAFTVPISGANVRTSKPAPRLPIVNKPAARAGDLQSPSASTLNTPTLSPARAGGLQPPSNVSAAPGGDSKSPALSPDLAAALQTAQQGMMALQKLQEQTAQLHAQFLAGQEAARRTLEGLLGQRRELLGLAPAPQGPRTPTSAAPSLPTAVSVPVERGFPSRSNLVTPAAAPALQPSQSKPVASVPLAPTGGEGRGEGRGEGAAATKSFSAPKPASSSVAPSVLAVVSEKTGYPVEMLTLDMGLDSDLGIDSIKRVEIMAALRTRLPDAPEVKPEHLGSLQTLQQVVDFLSVGTAAAAPTASPGASSTQAAPASSPVAPAVLAVVSEKTGYPVEMLNLDMGLDSDLGIDSIKRVEIMAALRTRLPDAPEVKPEHLGSLQTLQQVVDFLSAGARTPTAAAPNEVLPQTTSPGLVRPGSEAVAPAVLAVVAEKTGYPTEMLNLDMGLDSDLGIDSIKRVEIMAALRTRLPDAPEVKPEHLGSLQTLKQVVEFLTAGSRVSASASVSSGAPANQVESKGIDSASATRALLAVVAEKTGYPTEMLNLDMGLDSDLGIDSIKRVEIMAALRSHLPDAPEIKPEHLGSLQTLQQVVDFLTAGARTPTSAAPTELLAQPTSPGRGRPGSEAATRALLTVVSEKTGYPTEMLNLEMGLDSDLGIDSIKRVEIMAALRSHLPDAPEIKPEHLGSLQTLQQVVNFLTASARAGGFQPPSTALATKDGAHKSPAPEAATRALLSVVSEKTGYPTEMLNLDMGLDSDLGIDSIKRVEIMAALRGHLPDAPEIKPEHLGSLRTLQEVVNFLTAGVRTPTSAAPTELLAQPASPGRRRPDSTEAAPQLSRQILRPTPFPPADTRPHITLAPGSLVWLTDDATSLTVALAKNLEQRGLTVRRGTPTELLADRNAPLPAALVLLWPAAQGSDAFLKSAFRLVQVAAPALRAAGRTGSAALVSLSRLDGLFGLGVMNATADVVSGGLAGLVKTARHEWPEVHCKALDLDPGAASGTELANQITEEIFRAGPIEVGLFGGQRYSLQIETAPALDNPAPALQRGDLVVVTGGARGVTATSVLELARRHQPRFLLLGRSTLPDAEPHWLAGLTSEAEIKKALLAHADGDRSPKKLEAKFREVMAQREIRAHLAEIRATGALAHYATLNVRDAAAVTATLAEVRAAHGPIRGLIHGAGVLADKLIEQKTEEQFDLVYGTKVHGLRNLLAATAQDELRLIALFSSYTGRFGRTGQVDYAIANEVLNKMAQAEARRRPQCRVVAFNWGPWNGGMVTEGLRKIFEREGVGLIEPEAGADFFVRDVLAPTGEAVEVLALAQAPSAVARPAPHIASPTFHPAFDRDVSVRALPCLVSHVMNGRAVLPAALIIEWLAHGAMHGNPGLAFHGFNQFKVLKGLVLEGDSAAQVTVSAAPPQSRDGLLAVPVRFTSRGSNGKSTLHATAEILLADTLPAAPSIAPAVKRNGILSKSVYGDGRLFHGPDFQCIEALEVCNPANAAALVRSSPAPKTMIAQPLRPAWLADPLALDAAFQLMILWSTAQRSAPSLPCALRSFRQFAAFPKTGGSRVVARVTSAETPVAVADLQFFDRNGGLVALGEGYEFVVDANLREAFRQNHLPA